MRGRKPSASSLIVRQKEARFQEIYNDWMKTGKYNDEMWNLVIDCCKNIALYIVKRNCLYGPRIQFVDERIMDAAIDVIRRMKENSVHPRSLKAYASSWVTYHMQHKESNKAQENEYQLNAFLDENEYEDYTGEKYYDDFEDRVLEEICNENYQQ